MSAKLDAYQRVTNRIIEQLEAGTVPWHKPWNASAATGNAPRNLKGNTYRGTNAFVLGALAPYSAPWWGTYKAVKEAGGQVRKGEKGWPIIFFKWIEATDRATGEPKRIPLARSYSVFNSEQCDGLEVEQPETAPNAFDPIERAESIVSGMPHPPGIRHGGSDAYYHPALDSVQLPDRDAFESPEGYYSTAFHELGHSTGHASRLNRREVTDVRRFGSHEYAVEELVAELTASFLRAESGIDTEKRLGQSAAYIANWLGALRDDPRMVVLAAQRAQKAADYICNREAVAA